MQYSLQRLYRKTRAVLNLARHILLLRHRRFALNGCEYPYFRHWYNCAFNNERAVEVSIARRLLDEHKGGEILEVGNVLSHYFRFAHDTVDKYEKASGALNEDICLFESSKKYDLILTISTLEHVGFDEEAKDPDKPLMAFRKLTSLLKPGGILYFTVPAGYNPSIDDLIDRQAFAGASMAFMKRMTRDNVWRECSLEELRGLPYDSPFPYANGLVIGFFRKEP